MRTTAKLPASALGTALLVLSLAACGTVTSPARWQGSSDLVVRDFCGRFGRQKGLAVASLFADSARFDIDGLGLSFVGRGEIVRLAEYGAAVHERLVVRDFAVSRDTVRCRLNESNDWLALLGIKGASYDGWFRVSGTRILAARIRLSPDSRDELAGKLAGFLSWLLTQEPELLERLMPGGRPAFDSRVVPELLSRLRQWRSRPR
jgi:hypothetical protein